jgi:hypothetical protein
VDFYVDLKQITFPWPDDEQLLSIGWIRSRDPVLFYDSLCIAEGK